MSGDRSDMTTAVFLMRMALALLDKAGEGDAAVHLQHSIDVASCARIPRTADEFEAWLDEDKVRLQ